MSNGEPRPEDEVRMVPAETRTDQALDAAGKVIGLLDLALPGLGTAASAVLGGIGTKRRMDRADEVLNALALDFHEFKSEASEMYVRSDEFEELLEKTLLQAAVERSEEKRRMYGRFLAGAVKSPGQPGYEEQLRFLRVLEELQPDHLSVLKAMGQPPPRESRGYIGSPIDTLRRRVPDLPEQRIADLVEQLNDMRVTNLQSLRTTMTAQGAENLTTTVTDFGRRFLGFLVEPAK